MGIFSFVYPLAVVSQICQKRKTFHIPVGVRGERREGEGNIPDAVSPVEAEGASQPCLPPTPGAPAGWNKPVFSLLRPEAQTQAGLTGTVQSPSRYSREARKRGPGRQRSMPSLAP